MMATCIARNRELYAGPNHELQLQGPAVFGCFLAPRTDLASHCNRVMTSLPRDMEVVSRRWMMFPEDTNCENVGN
jgi:hypothetical protein